jgi:hypothetical protein
MSAGNPLFISYASTPTRLTSEAQCHSSTIDNTELEYRRILADDTKAREPIPRESMDVLELIQET